MDYIFEFKGIGNSGGDFSMTIPDKNESHPLNVYFNDSDFARGRQSSDFPSVVADLVDLAVSTCVADWLSFKKTEYQRHLRVKLPLRHPEIFGNFHSVEALQSILFWYTGDHWDLEFVPRIEKGRLSECQLCVSGCVPVEVALWSGGLDALAGVYNRSNEIDIETFTLFGTGSNKHTLGVQQTVYRELKKRLGARINLMQLPFYVNGAKRFPKNSRLRSRGFTFILLGVACALLQRSQKLFTYENGIGAINLPYRSSEVGLDHSRSVHPLSLLKMGHLVSEWLGSPFSIENPFMYKTKAQMCRIFERHEDLELVSHTVSCDSRHRQKGHETQCGYCSSCLLRRSSLVAAGVKDSTRYVVKHSRPSNASDRLHFRVMDFQVEKLRSILATENPWYNFTRAFPIIQDIVDHSKGTIDQVNVMTNLMNLYQEYAREWACVSHILRNDILG